MSEYPPEQQESEYLHTALLEYQRDTERLTVELTAARAELALHEDNARQSLEEIEALRGNFTEWSCRARAFEDERDQARAELAKAHRRIHGDESEDCVFCASKKQTPGGDDPQCYLCALEAELAALRAEQAKPLDRPDKPGYWWRWCDIFKKWEGPLWISLPAQTSLGKWLPASPPRDLREGGE